MLYVLRRCCPFFLAIANEHFLPTALPHLARDLTHKALCRPGYKHCCLSSCLVRDTTVWCTLTVFHTNSFMCLMLQTCLPWFPQFDADRDEDAVFYDISVAVDNKLFPNKEAATGKSPRPLASEYENQLPNGPGFLSMAEVPPAAVGLDFPILSLDSKIKIKKSNRKTENLSLSTCWRFSCRST